MQKVKQTLAHIKLQQQQNVQSIIQISNQKSYTQEIVKKQQPKNIIFLTGMSPTKSVAKL